MSDELRRVHDVDEFHRALYSWMRQTMEARPRVRPFFLGLSAPQGAGKTTIANRMTELAGKEGLRATAVSIDDFYLTREEQAALTRSHPENPYLEARGYPLTHDLELGNKTLRSLKALGEAGRSADLPVYDKSAHGGLGDRARQARRIDGPQDLIIFEGWLIGFSAVSENQLPEPRLAPVNRALSLYTSWWENLDSLIWLEAENLEDIRRWRIEAEQKAKASGRPALSDAAIQRYIENFLIAYRIFRVGSELLRTRPCLHLKLGPNRLPNLNAV